MLEGIRLQRIVLCEQTGFYVFLKYKIITIYKQHSKITHIAIA